MLQFQPFGISYAGERFAYMPYLGLLMTCFTLGLETFKKLGIAMHKSVVALVLCCWVSVLGFTSHGYCKTWIDDTSLWLNAQSVHPESHFPYFKLGTLAVKQGNRQEALNLFNKSIESSPTLSDAYTNRGMLFLENGMTEKALMDFEMALQLDSSYALVWMNYGVALYNAQRYSEAIASLMKAASIPNEIAGLIDHNLGRVYESQERLELANIHYAKAYQVNPERFEFIYRYARTEALLFNLNEAEIVTLQGLQRYPQNTNLLLLLSEIKASAGDFSEALSIALKAKELGAAVNASYVQDLRKPDGFYK